MTHLSSATLVAAFAVGLAHTVDGQSARDVEINRRALKADLVVSLEPRRADAQPSAFVVTNRGLRDAPSATMLTVTMRVLPFTREDLAEYERVTGEPYRGPTVERACRLPYDDFEFAVSPLETGASVKAVPPELRAARGTPIVATTRAAQAASTRLDASAVRSLTTRYHCVYEIRVQVDADEQVDESDERNNVVVHRFAREVEIDHLHYTRP